MFTAIDESNKHKKLSPVLEADTPIKRHVQIKGMANPHDPVWKQYFEAPVGTNREPNQHSGVIGCRKAPLQRLEPCEVKIACPVLRGRRCSNVLLLPDFTEAAPMSSTPAIMLIFNFKRYVFRICFFNCDTCANGNYSKSYHGIKAVMVIMQIINTNTMLN